MKMLNSSIDITEFDNNAALAILLLNGVIEHRFDLDNQFQLHKTLHFMC